MLQLFSFRGGADLLLCTRIETLAEDGRRWAGDFSFLDIIGRACSLEQISREAQADNDKRDK